MLQGTLDEFPLIDVLGILKARNKTGRLDIERQAGRGLIYVRLGEPYYAESSLTRSLIGQKLVDIGAITDMQLRKALDRQAESGDRLGEVLLTHGVISRDHIASAVISQIKDALADLLAWETGEFKWEIGAEVEVEVPVYGGMLDSANGSAPLSPHVVPVTTSEPAQAAPVARPVQGQEHSQPEFGKSGNALHGSAATAPQIDESPRFEPQVQPQLEVVHSPAVGGGSTDEESPPVPFDLAAAEPELHTAVENETEQHQASEAADEIPSGNEPDELEASESDEGWSYQGRQATEDDSDEEDSNEDSAEDWSYQDHEASDDDSHEDDSPDHEATDYALHDDDSVEEVSDEEASLDPELGDDAGDEDEVELTQVEVVESHDGTRVIKSQPAPEFDEEFDHMFAAAEEMVAEPEPQGTAAEQTDDETPSFEAEPVVDTPSFEAEPVVDDTPSFEAEPVVDTPSFEADPVVDEAYAFGAPVDEAPWFEPGFTATPPLEEAPSIDPAEHHPVASFEFASPDKEPIAEISESPPAVAPEVVAPLPPPPPPVTVAPEAPEAPEVQVTEVRDDEPNEINQEERAPQEPAPDIKLDRSSLVRELSDLLR